MPWCPPPYQVTHSHTLYTIRTAWQRALSLIELRLNEWVRDFHRNFHLCESLGRQKFRHTNSVAVRKIWIHFSSLIRYLMLTSGDYMHIVWIKVVNSNSSLICHMQVRWVAFRQSFCQFETNFGSTYRRLDSIIFSFRLIEYVGGCQTQIHNRFIVSHSPPPIFRLVVVGSVAKCMRQQNAILASRAHTHSPCTK